MLRRHAASRNASGPRPAASSERSSAAVVAGFGPAQPGVERRRERALRREQRQLHRDRRAERVPRDVKRADAERVEKREALRAANDAVVASG